MRTTLLRLGLLVCAAVFVVTTSVHADIVHGDQEKDLLKAAAAGDLEAVKAALAAGADVNAGRSDGWTALHAAAERSRTAVLKQLIAAGADVNARGFLEVTPLHWAAIRGPTEAVQALVEAGADVNAEAIREHTPLGAAAGAGNVEIVRMLIKAGADVNGGKWMTPLVLATRDARVDVIELLVESGANVNTTRYPPLHWAGKPEAAAALIKAGANVNVRDREGRTALHLTTGHWVPKAEAVKILLAAGADVNARSKTGSTPLHKAVDHRNLDTLKLLIKAKADVDVRDENGNTPLSLAMEVGEPFVKVLVTAGARDDGLTELQREAQDGDLRRVRALIAEAVDVNERGPRRTTAVHVASEGGHTDILEALTLANAKVNVQDEQGMTPLHLAANAAVAERLIAAGAQVTASAFAEGPEPPLYTAVAGDRADVVNVLIAHGAPIEGPESPGMLVWAAFFGHVDVVKTLLDNGAKTESEGSLINESALHVVAKASFADMSSPEHVTPEARLKIARMLIAKGANVNFGADVGYFDGFTPLHGAAGSGHAGIAKLLMEHGAQVNAASPTGMFVGYTPLHGAAKGGHVIVVNLLLEHGAKVNAKTGEKYFDGVLTPLDMASAPEVRALLVKHGGVESE